MRKVLTIAVAALMVVALVGAANAAASETSWRFNLKVDDGAGGGFGTNLQVGVATNATDGYDSGAGLDKVAAFGADLGATSRWATALIPGQPTNVYSTSIMSTASPYTYPGNLKIWDLRIAALPSATNSPMRLLFLSTSTNPSPTVGGQPVFFELKMIDNKGVVGAPANGTKWMLPIPTGAANSVFWQMDTALDKNGVAWGNLPIIKMAAADSASMLSAGYQMQLRMVPEPSSMLALGSGLTGLIGFVIRRRRA